MHKDTIKYLREKGNAAVKLHFKMPVPTPNGGVGFPDAPGNIVQVLEDGIVIRGGMGEQFFFWEAINFFTFPSDIEVAQALPSQ